MHCPEIETFYATYRGVAGAAAEFAILDGHRPNDFAIVLIELASPFSIAAIHESLTYTRRAGAVAVTLATEHAQALLTKPPEGYSLDGPNEDAERIARCIATPESSDSSWLVVLTGAHLDARSVKHRLHGGQWLNAKGGLS